MTVQIEEITREVKARIERARLIKTGDEYQPPSEPFQATTTSPLGLDPTDYECELCQDTGWVCLDVPVTDERFGKLLPCRCQTGQRMVTSAIRRRMERHGLNATDKSFEEFELGRRNQSVEAAWRAAQRFAERPTRCLLLWGPPGTGKTHLSAAIANQLLASGIETLMFTAPDFLDLLRSGFDDGAYQKLLRAAKNVRVLVIDDLGVEKQTDWGAEKIYQIINHRYNANAPLVLSTNYAPDAFGARLGDRLSDSGWVLPVHLNDKSYRRLPR